MFRGYGSLISGTAIALAALGAAGCGTTHVDGTRAAAANGSTARATAATLAAAGRVPFSSLVGGTVPSMVIPQLNIQLTRVSGARGTVTAAEAFQTAAFAATPFPTTEDVTASGSYELMNYTNLVAKNIGSSALEYNNVPAWVFMWTLAKDIDPPAGLVVPPGVKQPGDGFVVGRCRWISIVDATVNSVMEAAQVCPGNQS